ncbi:MAG: hypothetical protein GY829_14490, partial [Gammaproteobacteria bacterium]|nr:hypothetical protein [Gammaproteobacteria bacterium]
MIYPLSYRLFKGTPISPVILCMGLMFLFASSYVLLSIQGGFIKDVFTGKIPSIELRATLTVMILMAYVPMAQFYLIKWSKEHWQLLSESVGDLGGFDYRLSRIWGLIGMLLQFISFFGVFLFSGDLFDSNFWNLRLIFSCIFVVAIGWHLYRLLTSLLFYAKQFSKIAKSLPELELFETTLPKIFVQQGIRSALLIIGVVSICGNLLVAPGSRIDVAIILGVVSSFSAAMVFIYPVVGIHQRINETKQKQLSDLQLQIEPLTKQLKNDNFDWQKLSTLLALEARIKSVKEWPFDASSISR